MNATLRVICVLATLVLLGGTSHAKKSFKTKVPNANADSCSTCHTKTSKPAAWNAFGLDVQATLSGSSPDWQAVCGLDSDGDGWTNGEELLDPDCLWSPGQPDPGEEAEVTKPGDGDSFPPEPEPEPEPDVVEEPEEDAGSTEPDTVALPPEDGGPQAPDGGDTSSQFPLDTATDTAMDTASEPAATSGGGSGGCAGGSTPLDTSLPILLALAILGLVRRRGLIA